MCGILFFFSTAYQKQRILFTFKFELTFLGYHVFGCYAMFLKTKIFKFKLMEENLCNQ